MKTGYKHEVDKPSQPSEGHLMSGMGCEDYKSQADPIAYGQASSTGCKSDTKKINSQMKEYHWN